MNPTLLRSILLLALLFSSKAFGHITENRKFQLDSITTNIDKSIRKDLDKVHAFLHAQGRNDEERIWMFYGFIATHFKYDYDRKNKGGIRESYSNGYTAKKMSGVCEDFAHLFKELCDRSHINCLVVIGKTPVNIIEATRRFIQRKGNKTNHAWNIVKIDTAWKLMDPTWGSILRVEKRQYYDAKQKRNVSVSIKIVNRKYYATDPEKMKENHKPMHPAFYASPEIPTFKTGLRKEKRRVSYQKNYPFAQVLDSVFKTEYPSFSKYLHEGMEAYTSSDLVYYFFSRELSLPVQKTAVPLTIENYETSLVQVKKLAKYIEDQHQMVTKNDVMLFETQVNKKIAKLKRKAEMEKKGRR